MYESYVPCLSVVLEKSIISVLYVLEKSKTYSQKHVKGRSSAFKDSARDNGAFIESDFYSNTRIIIM